MKNKNLNEVEQVVWPKPSSSDSFLVKKVYEARNKALENLDAEDLRLLISQGHGLQFLLPMALHIVGNNPFVAGDYYDGDLLESILKQEAAISRDSELYKQLTDIVREAKSQIENVDLSSDLKNRFLKRFDEIIRK